MKVEWDYFEMFLLVGGNDLAMAWIKQKHITLYEAVEITFSVIIVLKFYAISIFKF